MKTETLTHFIFRQHTKSTAKNYLYTINNFLLLHPDAKRYKYSDIVAYVENLSDLYPAVLTRSRILSSIKRYYDYLLITDQRNDHPCKHLTIRRYRAQIQVQDLLSRDEMELLFNRPNRYQLIEVRNQVVLSLLIYQALTSTEICKMNLEDINLDAGNIYIKASKKIRSRVLPMHEAQYPLFENYIFNVRPKMIRCKTLRLVLTKLGTPISVDGLHAIFDSLKAIVPTKDICPKKIRMSVISYWLNDRKIPLEQVMDMSGQKWPSSTNLYKKKDAEAQRMMINKYHPLA